MGTIQLPGLASGIDTSTIIQQLMTANSKKLAAYQTKKAAYDKQSTALDDLRAKVSALQAAVSPLSDSANLEIFNTTSSDTDKLTVSASSAANTGSHSIEIHQLATAETWIQDTSNFKYDTDYVGPGTFIYSYNHQERAITTVANQTTLNDLVGLINHDEANPGVTASLLYQGGKYHLMLNGQQTGEDYQITVNASNTEVWKASSALMHQTESAGLTTKITELNTFNGTLGAGDNAYITIGGTRTDGTTFTTNYTVTAGTTVGHIIDEINSRFEANGVRAATASLVDGKICLTDNTCGASSLAINTLTYHGGSGSTSLADITMTESAVGGTVPESLASLASTSFTQTQNAQNSQIKINNYTPASVAEVQTLSTNVRPAEGHYHLSYGGETTGEILYDASLAEIQSALESLSTVASGDITVGGDAANGLKAGDLTFTFRGSAGNVGLISIDSSDLGTGVNGTVVETVKGNNNEWISRNSNSITDALAGITLNLHDVTAPATPVQITISKNTGSLTTKIQSMVNAYNDMISLAKTDTEYDPKTKKMGLLSDDLATSLIKTQTNDPFNGAIPGFVSTIDSFIQASDIGITMDGTGQMKFDTTAFKKAVDTNFEGVLEVLGATKDGNSNSADVQFYNASDKYTTAGTYNVKVKVEKVNGQNTITEAYIKLASESEYRRATSVGNLIKGNSEFNATTNIPKYPENSLQLNVNLTEGTYGTDQNPIIVRVKQGVAGALDDMLNAMLKTNGQLEGSKNALNDKIASMDKAIATEQGRLSKMQDTLTAKYARLEKTLATMQQQSSAVSVMPTK
jgi:flagellar hook-associated protein 2